MRHLNKNKRGRVSGASRISFHLPEEAPCPREPVRVPDALEGDLSFPGEGGSQRP